MARAGGMLPLELIWQRWEDRILSKRARPPALAKSQARAGPGARAELRADHRLGRGPANDLS